MLMVIDNVPTPTSCTRERAAARGPAAARPECPDPHTRPHMPCMCPYNRKRESENRVSGWVE